MEKKSLIKHLTKKHNSYDRHDDDDDEHMGDDHKYDNDDVQYDDFVYERFLINYYYTYIMRTGAYV